MDLISQGEALAQMPLLPGEHARIFTAARFDGLEFLSARFSTHAYAPHVHETYAIGTITNAMNVINVGVAYRF